jgi:hypothetical protein
MALAGLRRRRREKGKRRIGRRDNIPVIEWI